MNRKPSIKEIIELGDVLQFNYRLKLANDANAKEVKFEAPLTITIGQDELFEGLDQRLIGQSTTEKKIIIDNFQLSEAHRLLPGKSVHIGIKILKHEKNSHSSQTKTTTMEMDQNQTKVDDKTKTIEKDHKEKDHSKNTKELDLAKKLKQLEAENKLLHAKNEKLEQTIENNLNAFKLKQEQLNKKAQEEVLKIRHEIKEKAKTEISENKKYILQKFATDILNPLDTLYRTISFGSNQSDPNLSAYAKGFALITNQIFQILDEYGIEIIEPKVGDEFNAEFHEVHDLVHDQKAHKDQIVKVLSRGYKLHDRVLRPAKVDVAK